jgi:hypothetical protein
MASYLILLILEIGGMLVHCQDQGLEGVDQVVEDDDPPLLALIFREAAGVDDAHLLEHGRLSTFSSACKCPLVSSTHSRGSMPVAYLAVAASPPVLVASGPHAAASQCPHSSWTLGRLASFQNTSSPVP